jgi:hypothetical protein
MERNVNREGRAVSDPEVAEHPSVAVSVVGGSVIWSLVVNGVKERETR